MKIVRSTVALAVLLAPLAVWAADIPVNYTVREKQLKAALAGTTLTFSLFNDAACTGQVYTTPVLIENVALITKVKQFTPKNDTKLPNTVALQHTLSGVTYTGNLYLTVTGTGVIPVAGACQAQAARVAAPTCTDGIQNQNESDVDCGGSCFTCPDGSSCNTNFDCSSFNCMGGICQAALPSCNDGIQNQGETDVDCGGPNCPGMCNPGQNCLGNSDCISNVCSGGQCQP